MRSIADLDKNFTVNTDLGKDDIEWYDVTAEPFELYGTEKKADKPFSRLPKDVARAASKSVGILSERHAGVRARFSTDSPYIAIKAVMSEVYPMGHMAFSGNAGFDLYVDDGDRSEYARTFIPPSDMTDGYEALWDMNPATRRPMGNVECYTLYFPLYNPVSRVYIGIKRGSKLGRGGQYRDIPPVLYYGSSITQGACATRPGNAYPSMITRDHNVDHRNFGFSGNCKGELVLAQYFSSIEASVFVCDYDHNTPDAEHLEATYYPFYKEYRKNNPTTPYIMVTRTDCLWNSEKMINDCKAIIHNAYLKAKSEGDENVYFIDGSKIFEGYQRGSCLADGGHPTDIGFLRMAEVIGGLVGKLINRE